MHFLTALLPVLALASASHTPPHLRHRRLAHAIEQIEQREPAYNTAKVARGNEAHADAHRAIKRSLSKKGQTCRPREQQKPQQAAAPSEAATTHAPDAAVSPTTTSTSIDNQNAWAHGQHTTTTTTSTPAPSPSAQTGNGGGSSGGWHGGSGVLQVNDARCGWCNADDNNPNGSQDWLNCGVNNGGWNPPYVTLDQIKASDLSSNGVFAPCQKYFDMFRQYGGEFGIPPIMLASFAMQESTCNQWATGGGGEAGLMQIGPSNCEAGHDCYEVNYNIRRAAQLFSNMVNSHGGNVIGAVGAYNGWQTGMTYESATRAKSQGNCLWQNNLDYLTQFFNGWMQGKNGYSLGTYFNLRGC